MFFFNWNNTHTYRYSICARLLMGCVNLGHHVESEIEFSFQCITKVNVIVALVTETRVKIFHLKCTCESHANSMTEN